MQKFILIGSYVGEGVSGSHRQERFIRKAIEEGYSVQLIKPHGFFKGIHEFNSLQSFDIWKSTHIPAEAKGSVSNNKYKRFLVPLKYLLFMDIFGYGFFNTLKLLKIIFNKNNGSDYFLLVSSPAISSAVATYLFWKFSSWKIAYSVDMRDAWALHSTIKIFKFIRKWIEGKVLKNANHVITVSKYLKEEFDHFYKINTTLLYNVSINLPKKDDLPNEMFASEEDELLPPDSLNICYFGSLPASFYNIDEFCKGLINYLSNNNNEQKIRFFFYGPCGELESLVPSYPMLKDLFIFKPIISHSKAIYLMKNCSAVLFFGFNGEKNSGVVSTKIFEYFYLKSKIIAFDIRVESDLDWLFRRICNQSVLINDAFGLSKYLDKTFNNFELLPSCTDISVLAELDNEYNLFLTDIKSS